MTGELLSAKVPPVPLSDRGAVLQVAPMLGNVIPPVDSVIVPSVASLTIPVVFAPLDKELSGMEDKDVDVLADTSKVAPDPIIILLVLTIEPVDARARVPAEMVVLPE